MRLDPPREPGGEEFRCLDAEQHPNDDLHADILEIIQHGFMESKNPVHAIEAILYAYDAGIVPPVWAMDWLVGGLGPYLDSEGRKDIAELLGLKATGRGKAQPVPAYFADDKRFWLMGHFHILVRGFNVPINDAAVMICAREYGVDADPDGRRAGWLAEDYRRRWRTKLQHREMLMPEIFSPFLDDQRRRTFLDSFPPSVIPHGLK